MFPNGFASRIRLAAGLAVVIMFVLPARLWAEEGATPGRYLLIFDTSLGMKKRAAAVETTVSTMLATSLGGQLQPGDTIGAWTFNQVLQPGDFPLQVWNPDGAAIVGTNLTRFLKSRKYENNTRFEALQPMLNRVVRGSERLTVMIFCDGTTKITGTTFDNGINQLFEKNTTAQKKARQPFVVVLRSQQGKLVGCTVSYPPQVVSFPQFPPLPEPPPKPKTQVVSPPPVAVAPSLLITGKKVELLPAAVSNDLPASVPPSAPSPALEPAPALAAPTNAVLGVPENAPVMATAASSNPPAVVVVDNPPVPAAPPVVETAAAPPALGNPAMDSPSTSTNPAALPVAGSSLPTNTILAAVEKPAAKDKTKLLMGVVVLLAAGLVALLFMTRRSRSDNGSLISRSMHDK